MRKIWLLAIAIISFITIISGSLLKKAVAISLCGIVSLNSFACNPPLTTSSQLNSLPPHLQTDIETIIAAQTKQFNSVGQFQIAYGPVESEFYKEFQAGLRDSGALEVLAETLNSYNLNLPVDVPIVFAECGQENAFYIKDKQAIVVCMDLITAFADLFQADAPDTSLRESFGKAGQVLVFIVYHEMGHALVDLLDLPVTGKEEDAVDELAAVLLLEPDTAASERAILNTAISFLLQGQQTVDAKNIAFWDEHSLDMQRFYNLLCLMYGKYPEKYAALVEKDILPAARAGRCENEYAKKRDSWYRLLSPHINDNPPSGGKVDPPSNYPPQNLPNPELLW
ncbi:MAG TPA: hypothetical protein DEA78_15750 [Cyanobacteria bacterium UBA11159]|nr:hypothetical protein [Cyanobacteria bacterium UBA11367]HBE61158.1 hypothetical protein [Cyanobacteria bacterium UBA11366]HBK64000.1 hypothetical protein [Cyanobacteria bacterium UBA11166]HBR75112.1 hypothetical protein [Cyanobacteria bacterium UBA11159]HCA95115.1 hypothetical protein [Cyanobacteria bacterium UBA9226]